MKLSQYSIDRFKHTFAYWGVQKEFADPMYNYFVHGFSPGSFFTALLSNDCIGALSRSHPGNNVEALKVLCGWLVDINLRGVAWGDYDTVEKWLKLDDVKRRAILEHAELIFSEEKEIWMTLKGEKTNTPILY